MGQDRDTKPAGAPAKDGGKGKRPHKPKRPAPAEVEEVGGYDGQEPTTFGDWQHKGRVTDF